ncbi:hypothetical protein ACQPZG_31710 [Streptomyces sp. CA-294286]|uniref:hypothetical protein n=1 Tax=Streptomyces sp. CA-294286 TaxID=3240070 RepID=UPI003D8E7A74
MQNRIEASTSSELPHLYIGTHPTYGFVAASGRPLTEHLKTWLLERVMFEPVPGTDLHRLTEPSQDGIRRARQAVSDIRNLGIRVQADYVLDPLLTPDLSGAAPGMAHNERLVRIARAATAHTARRPAPSAVTLASPAPAATPRLQTASRSPSGRSR